MAHADPALDLEIGTAVYAVFAALDLSLTSEDVAVFTRWLEAREQAAYARGKADAEARL